MSHSTVDVQAALRDLIAEHKACEEGCSIIAELQDLIEADGDSAASLLRQPATVTTDSFVHVSGDDGTERLCRAVYGTRARPEHWLGGSNAKVLHDATDTILELRERVSEMEGIINRSVGYVQEILGP